jgi:hypothetical protein
MYILLYICVHKAAYKACITGIIAIIPYILICPAFMILLKKSPFR